MPKKIKTSNGYMNDMPEEKKEMGKMKKGKKCPMCGKM